MVDQEEHDKLVRRYKDLDNEFGCYRDDVGDTFKEIRKIILGLVLEMNNHKNIDSINKNLQALNEMAYYEHYFKEEVEERLDAIEARRTSSS